MSAIVLRTRSPHWRRPPTRGAWIAFTCALLVCACSTDFDPYAAGPPYFALDAAIDTRDDTLFVRVQDISVPPGAPPALLDAIVTLDALGTTQTITLRDSLTVLDAGNTGHLFWTTEPLAAGRTYRLQAVRDNDPTAESEVDITLPPATVSVLTGGSSSAPSLTFAAPLERASFVTVTYEVRRTDTGQTAVVTSRYSPFTPPNGPEQIRVSLSVDSILIRSALGIADGDPQQPAVTNVTVSYLAASTAALFVQDGRGQITWKALLEADWRVSPAALQAVMLQDGQG